MKEYKEEWDGKLPKFIELLEEGYDNKLFGDKLPEPHLAYEREHGLFYCDLSVARCVKNEEINDNLIEKINYYLKILREHQLTNESGDEMIEYPKSMKLEHRVFGLSPAAKSRAFASFKLLKNSSKINA